MKKIDLKNIIFLLSIFVGSSVVKFYLSFLMNGTFIYTDEFCMAQIAMHLAETFDLKSCSELLGVGTAVPSPLFSILISPIYYFFSGMDAYYVILTSHSVVAASLVFPLYGIMKRFINKKWIIYLFISFFIFIPQVLAYEKLLMSELLFIFEGLWFLYFYLKSFEKNKTSNKVFALFFAFLAFFTRPFGFVLPLAVLINEIILVRKKELLFHVLLVSLVMFCTFIYYYIQSTFAIYALDARVVSMFSIEGLKALLLALLDQLNSIVIPMFFIIPVLFFTYLFSNDNQEIKKIRFFLLFFVLLNFIVSFQQIFGYYIQNNISQLLTRYLVLTYLFMIIFSFIYLLKEKKYVFNNRNFFILIIFIIPTFIDPVKFKFTSNLDLGGFFLYFMNYSYICIYIMLFLLFIYKKRALLLITITVLFLINSYGSLIRNQFLSTARKLDSFYIFENTEYDILVEHKLDEEIVENSNYYNNFYFPLVLITKNNITLVNDLETISDYKPYDFVLTNDILEFEQFSQVESKRIYKVPQN